MNKFADAPLFRHFPRFAGAAVVLFGLVIIASWYADWRSILQVLPHTAPMQYNTALCFILCGLGLSLLTTGHKKIAAGLGGAAGLFTLLTLLEYLAGRDFSIDLIFFKPYFTTATAYPGRMSPLAAACFVLVGTGIILAGAEKKWRPRVVATGLLACMVVIIALVALFGYVFGIESAYGWGAYSRMAVNTAVTFLVLGLGLLIWAWQTARRENFNFLRWLPVTASLTLMVMVGFVSVVNMAELKNATLWRKHTIQVILTAQSFENNLIDIQRGARGYATLGDTNALASFQTCARLEPQQFNQLVELTHDNSSQQSRLKKLAAAMDDVFGYDNRVIKIHNLQGADAVLQTDKTGESRAVFGQARDIVNEFSQEEQKLLDTRGATEEADYHNAERLLVFGIALAAALLVLANYMATHEMNQRLRVETRQRELIAELQAAIAQVKTLSGLIPICGWCKKVRTDEGYLHTVEQFVAARTDATFSHGMCPTCAEKFMTDAAKANPK